MSYRFVAALALANLLATSAVAQYRPDSRPSAPNSFGDDIGAAASSGRIIGTVHTVDGHSVSDATIEVHDIQHGTVLQSVSSDMTGSFALYSIPPGAYEVTATSGLNQAHERVQVNSISPESSVDLRLPNRPADTSRGGSGGTVSFSQYSVPAKARALYDKAFELMDKGKIEDSRKKVDAALAIFPKFAEALSLRGALKGDVGKTDEAIADFQQAIQYDANYSAAYLGLASLLNSTGQFKEASPVLEQVERLAPNAWQTYFERARNNLGKRDFSAALRDINRSSELRGGTHKELPEMHLVRGFALVGLTEMPQAAREIESFLKEQPTGHLADRARNVLDKLRSNTITASN